MKYIVAIIRPNVLEELRQGFDEIGIVAMTVSEVGGYGRQKGHSEVYRGAEYQTDMNAKVKVEIALPDAMAEKAVELIREIANSQTIGDGKVFLMDLASATRIRTGETGDAALGQNA
jgi:nitrogen regulatory protein P-II 2